MTVLVTGSSGFVGAALCAALVSKGRVVVGLDRAPPTEEFVLACRPREALFSHRTVDVRDERALLQAFEAARAETVVIAAAITTDRDRERRDPAGIVALNVGGVAATVRGAALSGVRRIVHLGSGAVYGDSARLASPLREDETPLLPRSLYAITKQAGEAVALRLGETFGIEVLVGRLGTCFGPFERDTGCRDTLSAPYQVLRCALAGTPVVLEREGRRDWLYIRDAVDAVLALLDVPRPAHRIYNLAAGFEWSVADWCRLVAARRRGFEWRIGDDPTIALHDGFDRAPMSIERITAETAYRPRFDRDAAFDDFMKSAPALAAALARNAA